MVPHRSDQLGSGEQKEVVAKPEIDRQITECSDFVEKMRSALGPGPLSRID